FLDRVVERCACLLRSAHRFVCSARRHQRVPKLLAQALLPGYRHSPASQFQGLLKVTLLEADESEFPQRIGYPEPAFYRLGQIESLPVIVCRCSVVLPNKSNVSKSLEGGR